MLLSIRNYDTNLTFARDDLVTFSAMRTDAMSYVFIVRINPLYA